MREILYRGKIQETEFQNIPSGWGQQNGDWVEGLYYVRKDCVCNGYEYCECEGFDQCLISDSGRGDYPIDIDTLGQFTGLTDKNGTKIFEGDIVKESRDIGVVEFSTDEVWSCRCCNDKFDGAGFIGKSKYGLMCLSECEIIGNIFDNPELLEVTNANNKT